MGFGCFREVLETTPLFGAEKLQQSVAYKNKGALEIGYTN